MRISGNVRKFLGRSYILLAAIQPLNFIISMAMDVNGSRTISQDILDATFLTISGV